MARDLFAVVREMCFSFLETDEVTSHGAPNFRVAGKSFDMLSVNQMLTSLEYASQQLVLAF